MHKVNQYIQTRTARKMKNFDKGIIKKEHLMGIVLYTDFTELSSQFTKSFRRKNPFETKEQVKKRNDKYWWWSKVLKDTLWYYGKSSEGPFYTGMSWVMTLPQFNIYLYSPTSTSVKIAVAMTFCGDAGMIMEFDQPADLQGSKGFDCSWISRFREEDERYDTLSLFSGCHQLHT